MIEHFEGCDGIQDDAYYTDYWTGWIGKCDLKDR